MKVAGAVFRAIVVGHMATAASGVNVPCSAGTRVYSLTVWSGHWLDGLVMRCTGDSEEEPIPSELNDDAGGSDVEGICAGTEGVQSLEWLVPTARDGVMTYVNITCLDNSTYEFANRPFDEWGGMTGSGSASCDEGEYVKGLTYEIDYESGTYPYYLSAVGFMCSSSTLDPICTYCSGDTTLLSDEDQPEYCELPSCTEDECCEPMGESDSITNDIVVGVVSTVIATVVLSGSAWAYRKFKIAKGDWGQGGGPVNYVPHASSIWV